MNSMEEIISRDEARAQGLTRYFTGEPCKWGHISKRSVIDQKCVECTLSRQQAKRVQARAEAFPEGRDPWKRCEPGFKVCRKCRGTKAEIEFSPDKRALDGLQPQCRACQVGARKERYHADVEAARAKSRERYAANFEAYARRAKSFRERHREALAVSKKAYYDQVKLDPEWQERQREARSLKRDEKRAYDVEYRARNPERAVARANAWRKRNPEKRSAIIKAYSARRRANCADGDPTALIAAWEKSARKVCYWCGKACARNYHVDHYEPLARGGRHVISNLVIACPPCNYRKNAKDPYQFAAQVGRLF